MAEKHSSEFKAKVALDAITQNQAVIEKVAQKYNISEEEVREWTATIYTDAVTLFRDDKELAAQQASFVSEDAYITTDNENFHYDVSYGVTKDDINFNKLIFWSSVIVGLVIVMAIGLVYFAQFSLFDTQQKVSKISPASNAQILEAEQLEELNSFGVVDLENGIYRIPIDSAINKIATE